MIYFTLGFHDLQVWAETNNRKRRYSGLNSSSKEGGIPPYTSFACGTIREQKKDKKEKESKKKSDR